MKSGHRLALLLWFVLLGDAGFNAPSSAGEVAATSARIAELSRAENILKRSRWRSASWKAWRKPAVPSTAMSQAR